MLSNERINEAETNVGSYLNEGLLRKSSADNHVLNILLRNAKESLRVAEDTYQNRTSDLWVIVCSYYAMYYYTNAVLLKLGYKVGDKIVHKVTSDALIVFVRNKLKKSLLESYEETKEEALSLAGMKADSLIESFEFERYKRGLIQYRTIESEKQSKAKTSLKRAKEFTREMEKFLNSLGNRH
ncbi:HEPN domain-containing protein [Candidatus Woesearchaeota archaeon]|nr:HEPN domain-containing protein [Candidatus Woesearchaeota archaeon]